MSIHPFLQFQSVGSQTRGSSLARLGNVLEVRIAFRGVLEEDTLFG